MVVSFFMDRSTRWYKVTQDTSYSNYENTLNLLREYRDSLEENPKSIHYACSTAELYARLGLHDRAIETIQRSMAVNTEDDNWLIYRLACLYEESGNLINSLLQANVLWDRGIRTDGLRALINKTKEEIREENDTAYAVVAKSNPVTPYSLRDDTNFFSNFLQPALYPS